jgi:enoyl-CoA hydratase/carnithine racemase
MNAEILDTKIVDEIAVVTLGSPKRLYFDAEMGDALTGALETFAGDRRVRVVIVTGGAPGYFNRHFDIPSLIRIAEDMRASGRELPENATYNDSAANLTVDSMQVFARIPTTISFRTPCFFNCRSRSVLAKPLESQCSWATTTSPSRGSKSG